MKLFIQLVIFVFSTIVFSKDIYLLDQKTLDPISGVLLYQNLESGKKIGIMSDINGMASLSLFNDNIPITISHISYQNLSLNINDISTNVLLKSDSNRLSEIVISASKFSQNLREVSQRVKFISSNDIELSNPQTSADLLTSSGNVYIQKSQLGGGSPIIRGFATNRLTLSVDGVRLNNAIFRGGNIHNVISIDPLNIESTELVLGSSSVIYGSDAIGGAMNFQTKSPKLSDSESLNTKLNLSTRRSSANMEETAHLDFNIGLKNFASYSSFTDSNFQDLKMGKNGPNDYLRPEYVEQINNQDIITTNPNPRSQKFTAFSQTNFMQKFLIKKDNIEYDLGYHYSKTSNIPRYDRLTRYNDDQLHYAEWYYGPQKWMLLNSRIKKTNASSNYYDKLLLTTALQKFNESRNSRKFNSNLKNQFKEKVNIFSINLDLEKSIDRENHISYGFEFLRNKVNSLALITDISNNSIESIATRYPNGSTWKSIASYLSHKYKPNQNLTIQSGLRYSHFFIKADLTQNNLFYDFPFSNANLNTGALTGAIGLSWIQNDKLTWKFNLTTAFRAPNIDDIGKIFDSAPGMVVVPNPDLKPEKSLGLELVNFYKPWDKVKINYAFYYTYLYNAMVRSPFSLEINEDDSNISIFIDEIIYNDELSQIYAIQNTSKSWIYGFEAGLDIELFNNLSFLSQYNYIGGEQQSINSNSTMPVRHVSPHFGNIYLKYSKNKIRLDLYFNYNAELSHDQMALSERSKSYLYALDKNGNPYSPAWHTYNLRSLYELNENLTFTFAIENINNKLYRPYSSGISAPGTNFIFSVNCSL